MKYEKWVNFWDSIIFNIYKEKNVADPNQRDWYRVKQILEEYSQGSELLIGPRMLASNFFSFFKGHWNHHHRNEVVNVISWYNHPSGGYVATKDEELFFRVDYLLASLKKEIEKSGNTISPSGDLNKILNVILVKTGIDYYSLDHTKVIQMAVQHQEDSEKEQSSMLTRLVSNL